LLPVAILAGGLATRLRPLTGSSPKALLDVNGEPFIAHQLRLLARNGIDRVVLCVGFLGDMIRDVVGDGQRFGLRVDYSFDGPQLLGTAGAVRHAASLLGEAFFVLYGDSYLLCDYAAVQRAFERGGCAGLMTVYRNEGLFDRSNVEFAAGGVVVYDKRRQTPRMEHIDYGLGVFERRVFVEPPGTEFADLAEVYADLLARHELAAFEMHERFYEIGSFEGLQSLRQLLTMERVR
jgi:NDP-sugar pyrophosphorylase family protein